MVRRTIPAHLRHLADEFSAALDHEHLPALASTLRDHLLLAAVRAETLLAELEILRPEAADRERALGRVQRVLAVLDEVGKSLAAGAETSAFEDGATWVLGQVREALTDGGGS